MNELFPFHVGVGVFRLVDDVASIRLLGRREEVFLDLEGLLVLLVGVLDFPSGLMKGRVV